MKKTEGKKLNKIANLLNLNNKKDEVKKDDSSTGPFDAVFKLKKDPDTIISSITVFIDNVQIQGQVSSFDNIKAKYDEATYDGNRGEIINQEGDDNFIHLDIGQVNEGSTVTVEISLLRKNQNIHQA